MNRLIGIAALLMLGGMLTQAQDKPRPDPPSERKMIEVKYLRGSRLETAVRLLNDFMVPGDARQYGELNAILLRGTVETIAAGELLLKKFDMLPGSDAHASAAAGQDQNFQLRIYLVEALPEQSQSNPLPTEIVPAVEQMKKNFVYKSYRLMETVMIQVQPNTRSEPQVSGVLSTGSASRAPTTYRANIGQVEAIDGGKTLVLRRLDFNLRVPIYTNENNFNFLDTSLRTDLTLRPGQKLVVGKLSKDTSNGSVFLIVSAEPVQ